MRTVSQASDLDEIRLDLIFPAAPLSFNALISKASKVMLVDYRIIRAMTISADS